MVVQKGKNFGILSLTFFLLFLWVALPGCGGQPMGTRESSNGMEDGGLGSEPGLGASGSFDLDLALELGRLCLQSYQMLIDFNKGKDFQLPAPYTLIKQFYTDERYAGEASYQGQRVPIAFIATKGENIYLVFRGTVTITEWIDDAEFSQVAYSYVSKGGMTETGFTQIYGTLQMDIIATIKNLSGTGSYSTLYITGHSLGAALAVLAVPQLSYATSFSKPIFYNFAGPRVGNPHFAETIFNFLNLTSWRVVNTNDLVPKLPEPVVAVYINNQLKTFFYDHVNQEQEITFGMPISGPTDFKAIEEDHIMCNYYNALCEMTEDVDQCKKMADGADGCNSNPL